MGLLVMTIVLAPPPMSALAQSCGGQMDHSMMGSDHMGSSGHMGSGNMGSGHMGGSGQMAPGYTGSYGYADPNATASGQPTGTWVPGGADDWESEPQRPRP